MIGGSAGEADGEGEGEDIAELGTGGGNVALWFASTRGETRY